MRHAQTQPGVFREAQPALGYALFDELDARIDLAKRHLRETDPHQRVAGLLRQRIGGLPGHIGLGVDLLLDRQVAQPLVASGLRAGAQGARLEALVGDSPGLGGQAGLQRQLGHFHEIFGSGQRAAGQPQAHHVQRESVAEPGLARQASQVGVPVILLGVTGQQLFQCASITHHVAGALLCVGQTQQVAFIRAAPGLFSCRHRSTRVACDGREVATGALQKTLHLPDAGTVVAGLHGLVDPLGGTGVVALLREGRRQLFGHLTLLGTANLWVDGLQRLDGGGHVTCALRGGSLHAVDRELLGCGSAAHGLGLAHFGQSFSGFAGLQQLRRLLKWPAYFRAQALRLGQRHTAGSNQYQGQGTQGLHGQFRNCSLPTMPILVTPRRCAEAMIMATYL